MIFGTPGSMCKWQSLDVTVGDLDVKSLFEHNSEGVLFYVHV